MRSTLAGLLRRLGGSVRVRVTAAAILALAGAITASALAADAGLRHERERILLSTAEEQARVVVTFNPELAAPLALPADASVQSGLVQVLRNGRVVGASRLLRRFPPLWYPGDPEVMQTSDVLGDLARDIRVVAVPVTSNHVQGTVVVVTSLEQYDHSVAVIHTLLTVGAPLLLLLLGVICWLIVGRALRPIELMRREVAEVATVTGTHRVAEPANDDEVGRLARTLNSMLDRMQASTERERRFVSDASHELRSPIANIRTGLEVALHHPAGTDWPQVAAEVLDQNDRMDRLVSGLLLLARSDEGSLVEAGEPTDMAAVVASVVAAAPDRPEIRLSARPAPVRVPPVYVERMVTNLVDNARRFAVERVTVEVGPEAGAAVVRVRDDGPGVPPAERHRIFERFVRLDEARDRDEGGFGLGLAIVADLARFYRGTIEVTDAAPGAEFLLRLPLAPPARGSGQAERTAAPAHP